MGILISHCWGSPHKSFQPQFSFTSRIIPLFSKDVPSVRGRSREWGLRAVPPSLPRHRLVHHLPLKEANIESKNVRCENWLQSRLSGDHGKPFGGELWHNWSALLLLLWLSHCRLLWHSWQLSHHHSSKRDVLIILICAVASNIFWSKYIFVNLKSSDIWYSSKVAKMAKRIPRRHKSHHVSSLLQGQI